MTCIPPAISEVVDADDDGRIKLRADASVAVLVVSDTKFAAWKSMFPAGLNKAVESKYNNTHRLWFVMTGIPAGDTRNLIRTNMVNNKISTGKTGRKEYDVGIQKTSHHEQYEEYLSTPAAEAPLHGFFAVYRMRTPDGVHTTKKKPCNKYGHTKELDPKTGADVGGVKLFTATAAELMDVLNQPHRRNAVIAVVRNNLTYAARKRQEEAWDDVYHTLNACCWIEEKNAPEEEQAAAWEVEAEAEKASAEAGAELEYLQTVEISLLLGRRFDASRDGIIALDCDGHHPPEDFDTDAIYREVSASGTGDHILYRVPKDLIPDTSGNKIKSTIDGREYELFYGQGNGLAISGKQAIANPNAPTLNMESPAGEIITQLIHSGGQTGGRKVTFPTTRTTAGVFTPPAPQQEPDEITPQELRKIKIWEFHERGEVTKMMKMTGTNEPYTTSRASEAFASITTKIAMHAAIEAHKEGIRYEHIATTARILRLWETHRIYRQAYAGGSHEYNDSKIRLTVGKAKAAGWQLYTELMTHPQPLNQRRARQ